MWQHKKLRALLSRRWPHLKLKSSHLWARWQWRNKIVPIASSHRCTLLSRAHKVLWSRASFKILLLHLLLLLEKLLFASALYSFTSALTWLVHATACVVFFCRFHIATFLFRCEPFSVIVPTLGHFAKSVLLPFCLAWKFCQLG